MKFNHDCSRVRTDENAIGFVSEFISDEDKARFDFTKIKRPPIYRETVTPYTWAIDRTRDAFLLLTRGGNEGERSARHFVLWWGGDLVELKLQYKSTGLTTEHVVSTWTLDLIAIPAGLEVHRTEIIGTLREALAAYKVAGAGVPVASHEAHFRFEPVSPTLRRDSR